MKKLEIFMGWTNQEQGFQKYGLHDGFVCLVPSYADLFSSVVKCRGVFSSFTCVSQPLHMFQQQFSLNFEQKSFTRKVYSKTAISWSKQPIKSSTTHKVECLFIAPT